MLLFKGTHLRILKSLYPSSSKSLGLNALGQRDAVHALVFEACYIDVCSFSRTLFPHCLCTV